MYREPIRAGMEGRQQHSTMMKKMDLMLKHVWMKLTLSKFTLITIFSSECDWGTE